MPVDFDAIRRRHPLHRVAAAYVPDLRQQGGEYKGLCPFHDDHDPSFTIYTDDKGDERYYCFACGAGGDGGDVIDFVQNIRRCDTKEAIQWLENGHVPSVASPESRPAKPKRQDAKWKPIIPLPADTPKYNPEQTYNPKRDQFVKYRPERIDPYTDEHGELLFYVVRLNLGPAEPGGKRKKITPTVSYCQGPDGERAWAVKRPPGPHPLFNLPLLTKFPTRSVLVVSGEKCAAAAEELNVKNGFIPVTWLGGDNAVDQTDWSPLAGRRVVFFPDADDPGRTAMSKIPGFVGAPLELARHIDTEGLNKGADIADLVDTGVTGKDLVSWLKDRVRNGPVPMPAHEKRREKGNKVTDTGPPKIKENRPTQAAVAPPSNVVPIKVEAEVHQYGANVMEYSDQYNIARFRQETEGKVLYVPEWKSSMIWNEEKSCWENELVNPLMSFTGQYLNALAKEASNRYDLAKEAKQHAKRLSTYAANKAITNMVREDRFFRAGSGTFDINPYEIGVPGGVVDLRTGQHRPRRAEDRITKQTRVAPEKREPKSWLKFLNDIMGGDQEMIDYLQMLAGYCLTGDTTEAKWFFLYGSGRNGKSTYINTVAYLLGDYYKNGQTETFMQTYGDRHPSDVAALQGARLVTAMEVPDNKTWNVVRLKQMTGGDPVTARIMRGDDFTYMPQFKLVFTGNDLPRLRGVDEALRRRLHLIPFDVTIADASDDKGLPERLKGDEGPAILNWMLEGCQRWFSQRIRAPKKVKEATDEYMDDSDIIGQFIDEELRQSIGALLDTQDAYERFRTFTENANEWQGRQRWLTRQLKLRGMVLTRTTVGGRTVRGFRDWALRLPNE